MGLMDQFKDAAAQAQQAAGQAGGMQPDAATMEYAALANKLASSGIDGVAAVKAINETGKTDAGGAKEYAIDVTVDLSDRDGEYDATINQYLVEVAVPHYQAGAKVEVKADPDDVSKLMLYGSAS